MSHTDKTRPAWVQIKDPDNRGWARERHDHSKGPCTLGPIDDIDSHVWFHRGYRNGPIVWNQCVYDHSRCAYYGGLYGRVPRKNGWGRAARDGRARMHLRRIRAEFYRTMPQDWDCVDDVWMHPTDKLLWHKWRD